MEVKSEIEVAQSCLTLSDPMDCGPPGSSIHGSFQARVLEWVASAFSRDLADSWKCRSGAQRSLGRINYFIEHYSLFESKKGE